MATLKATSAIVASCLALTACATTNTPQQTVAYERWARCDAPYVQLERVETDGRITFLASSSSDRAAVRQCLAEANQTGPRLPEPLAPRPSGGP